MSAPVVLEGLFQYLVREGFRLSVRDLNDALRALDAGFGIGSRKNLMWLCETLWARTEEEKRRIAILFNGLLPRPTSEEIAQLTGAPHSVAEPSQEDDSPPEDPATLRTPPSGTVLDISAPEMADGIGLPKAAVTTGRDAFIVTPMPLVTLRQCVVAWRRFRRALRTGPKVEFDVEQTIVEKARNGIVTELAMVARRTNQARVILLIDAGPAMAAWRHSVSTLVESLCDSSFGMFGVFYFHETPSRLFESSTLNGRVRLRSVQGRLAEAPVMIVSDAGAARGAHDPERVRATRDALSQFGNWWWPVAWLNPMPAGRWRSTPAASIARSPGVSMLPFTSDGLIQAIDALRGYGRP